MICSIQTTLKNYCTGDLTAEASLTSLMPVPLTSLLVGSLLCFYVLKPEHWHNKQPIDQLVEGPNTMMSGMCVQYDHINVDHLGSKIDYGSKIGAM